MKKKNKSTKKSLVMSAISLVLCVAMLMGTTFAWFTDSVSSGVNTIKAGNLDIELEYSKTGNENDWHTVQDATQLFADVTLWEPGATSVVYLRLSNNGTLDLKYRFSMAISNEIPGTNVEGNPFNLSNYLKFSMIEGNTVYASREAALAAAGTGTTLSAQNAAGRAHDEVGTMNDRATRQFALVVFMPEGVGNVANPKPGTTTPEIKLGLNLVATQLASEDDSFDNQYDNGANADGDYMSFASAVVTAPTVSEPMEIVLSNNAPVSPEKNTTFSMAATPAGMAGKEVEFASTAMNDAAAQANFSVATGNSIEVAALKLEMKVDDVATSDLGGTATITTYIRTGLTDVNVVYVGGTGAQPTNVQYDPATGKLTFDTTHFSDYVVTAKALKENNDVYEIHNANDLFNFAKMVNMKGNSFSGKTVKLMANIDLNNAAWTPVGQTGATQFQGTFDGGSFTIKNMTVNNPSENVNVSSGFFGWLENTTGVVVKNVKFENASVTGSHYVGVVAGWVSGTISGCEVKDSEVVGINMNDDANGDKIGGIVGYVNDGTVTKNKVIGGCITGNRDIGGITGAIVCVKNGTAPVASFTENTVSGTTIAYVTDKSYASAGAIVSGRTGAVPDSTNIATNVTVIKADVVIDTVEELLAFAADVNAGNSYAGKTIALGADLDLQGITWTPIGNTTRYAGEHEAEDVVFAGSFNGCDHKISNLYVIGEGGNIGFFGKVKFSRESKLENIVFDNATVIGNMAHCVGVLAGSVTADGVKWVSNDGNGGGFDTDNVTNIKVMNSTVKGSKYVGGVIGYAQTDIDNVEAINTKVTAVYDSDYQSGASYTDENDSGENAGAVVGDLYSVFSITRAKVTDCTVGGFDKVGGVAGSSKSAHRIANSTVTNLRIEMVTVNSSSKKHYGLITGRVDSANGYTSRYTGNTAGGTATCDGTTITITEYAIP